MAEAALSKQQMWEELGAITPIRAARAIAQFRWSIDFNLCQCKSQKEEQTMTEQFFDVVVVGGGPAGSTSATLLAKKGYSVLLAEKEKFPRYHIGESTVPGILPVLEELGITEDMASHAFVVKEGITLAWGQDRELWSVSFADAGPLTGPYDHAFQRKEVTGIIME